MDSLTFILSKSYAIFRQVRFIKASSLYSIIYILNFEKWLWNHMAHSNLSAAENSQS